MPWENLSEEVAAEFGEHMPSALDESRALNRASRRRDQKLGFNAHRNASAGIDWSRCTDFGRISDGEIAKKFGVAKASVHLARKRLGAPLFVRKPPYDQAKVIAMLGKRSDRRIAAEFGLNPETVRQLRLRLGIRRFVAKLPFWCPELGDLPDGEIAGRYGVTSDTVRFARKRLGIPSPIPQRGAGAAVVDWVNVPLGEVSDRALARRLGVHHLRVFRARHQKGIPPHTARQKEVSVVHAAD